MYPHETQRRIIVTGMAASRKSTFSRALAVKTLSAWQRLPDQWRLIPLSWRNRRAKLERELAIIARHGQHATRHVLKSERAIREFLDGSVDVAGRGHGDGRS